MMAAVFTFCMTWLHSIHISITRRFNQIQPESTAIACQPFLCTCCQLLQRQTCLRVGMHSIYNEYCLSFDRSKFCVTTGFWLIILSSDIVIARKWGLPNVKGSILTKQNKEFSCLHRDNSNNFTKSRKYTISDRFFSTSFHGRHSDRYSQPKYTVFRTAETWETWR